MTFNLLVCFCQRFHLICSRTASTFLEMEQEVTRDQIPIRARRPLSSQLAQEADSADELAELDWWATGSELLARPGGVLIVRCLISPPKVCKNIRVERELSRTVCTILGWAKAPLPHCAPASIDYVH